MSIRRDADRLGLSTHEDGSGMMSYIDVPKHLEYKPYTVPNPYQNVQPRYLDPKKKVVKPTVEQMIPKPKIGERSYLYHNVTSRILNPRKDSPVRQPIPRLDGKTLDAHEEMSKRQFASSSPRYLDPKKAPDGTLNPREEVEKQRERDRRLTGWRSVCTTPVSMSFDEYRQRNRRLLAARQARDHLDIKPRSTSYSPIRAYIRESTPINHHTMGPNYQSPSRKHTAADDRHWTPSGRSRSSLQVSRTPSATREAAYIDGWRERAAHKKVDRHHIPRVAALSSAQSFRRWESAQTVESNDFSTPDRRGSPTRNVARTASGNGLSSTEVVVGPAMVSVPVGTVIKVDTHSNGRRQ